MSLIASKIPNRPMEKPLPPSAVYVGDAATILPALQSGSVRCCITSPPYWGPRDLGHPDQAGAEPQPEAYVENLLLVFREVRRILTPDGTLWLYLGDGYTSGNRKTRALDKRNSARAMAHRPETPPGLKPKDLLGLPWRVAFALQRDGWYLRADIVWDRPNAQPESVKDRPSRSHEYLFLLSKKECYYYNHEGAKEPTADKRGLRKLRTVWSIHTACSPDGLGMAFPRLLVERCLRAGTRPGDTVLDPFMGSGVLGEACLEQGRRFVGIELDAGRARRAAQRLARCPRAGGLSSAEAESAAVGVPCTPSQGAQI